MNRRMNGALTAVLTACSLAAPANAAEPWADRALPKADGLVLWLDAARQNEARAAHGLPPLPAGAPLALWYHGAVNLLDRSFNFGEFRTIEVVCRPGPGGAQLFVDGRAAGKRDRGPGALRLDELTVGARFYSNTPEPPFVQGFLDGDLAEVLLF